MNAEHPVHPRGSQAKILFTGVFGPYARDDEYGSRSINPMELYHNQVTRVQGPFSIRMFHRTFGLLFIEANIDAPCTMLDFPTLDRFIEEIKDNEYDIVGISAIPPNYLKVKKMCELIREHLPGADIIVGGHIATMGTLPDMIDADHIVKGDGVRWFRQYLGQDVNASIKHPLIYSGFGTRALGLSLPEKPGDTAAVVIPSVGCPMGCNFCSTSALFGGKGNHVSFYDGGDDLFTVLCQMEEKLNVSSFFVLDENFLLHKKRALRLLELMKQHDKPWVFYVFSSARVIRSYTIEQLVGLGISWVWMGLEGEKSQYDKLSGVDTLALVKELQSHGICVLGSTIIGMENHTPENIDGVIEYAVSHDTDFHQFMLYTPVPGTPFYEQMREAGTLYSLDEFSPADAHGQYRFNYRHKHIPEGRETDFLLKAFNSDFAINGPSLARMVRTMLQGWIRYKNHPDRRVRNRYAWESQGLKRNHAAAIWAMRTWYRDDSVVHPKIDHILRDLYNEFGFQTRVLAPILGRFVYYTMKREARRLARGWTYEPTTVYEKNARARELDGHTSPASRLADLLASVDLSSIETLKMIPRPQLDGKLPFIVELEGVFNSKTAANLKKRVDDYLSEHTGNLAINFNGVTTIEREAILSFLEKLKDYKARIKIVSSDFLRSEMEDVIQYARQYFDVFSDEDGLAASMA